MHRNLPSVAGLVLGATFLLAGAASAASPAAGWTPQLLDAQAQDPCVAMNGLAYCDRPGALVAKGQKAMVVTTDGPSVVYQRSTDGGDGWGAPQSLVPGHDTLMPAAAIWGFVADVAWYEPDAAKPIRYRSTADLGATWGTGAGFKAPRQVVTHVGVAVNDGVHSVLVAGYDEVPQDRPFNAIRIRTGVEGIDAPVQTTTIAWGGYGCLLRGVDPSIAITGKGHIVVAYWQTCDKLVVRRSTDLGASFGPAKTLSTGHHELGMSIAAKGTELVIAYTADGTTYTRHSADQGASWSPPVATGTGAASLRVTHAHGAWRLLAAGTTSVRYRSSVNGTSWSAGETVDSQSGARTYAIGVAWTDQLLAAYAIRQSKTQVDLDLAID